MNHNEDAINPGEAAEEIGISERDLRRVKIAADHIAKPDGRTAGDILAY